MIRYGYCIYSQSISDCQNPVVRDARGFPVVFDTEEEARREIAKRVIGRCREFLVGKCEYEQVDTVPENVVPVDVHPDGLITDEDGNLFSAPIV